jgi:type IV secretion system protein VirB9
MAENCGDKGNWDIQDNGRNLIFIKPLGTEAGRDTNLYVTTASGNVYGFLLREVSNDKKTHADIKISVQQGDQDSIVAMKARPKFVPADEVAALQKQVADLQRQAEKPKTEAKPALVHDYVWDRGSKAAEKFGVQDIWHDDKFTYVRVSTQDAPSLYDIEDGKPALAQYQLTDGLYTVPKILDKADLRLGKTKMEFRREKGQS